MGGGIDITVTRYIGKPIVLILILSFDVIFFLLQRVIFFGEQGPAYDTQIDIKTSISHYFTVKHLPLSLSTYLPTVPSLTRLYRILQIGILIVSYILTNERIFKLWKGPIERKTTCDKTLYNWFHRWMLPLLALISKVKTISRSVWLEGAFL